MSLHDLDPAADRIGRTLAHAVEAAVLRDVQGTVAAFLLPVRPAARPRAAARLAVADLVDRAVADRGDQQPLVLGPDRPLGEAEAGGDDTCFCHLPSSYRYAGWPDGPPARTERRSCAAAPAMEPTSV